MKLASLLLLSSFIILSCGERTPSKVENLTANIEGDGWSKWGPTLPIYLKGDSSVLFLSDYLLYEEILDSAIWRFSSDEGESIKMNIGDSQRVVIQPKPSEGIGILSLYTQNSSRDIVVLGSSKQIVEISTSGGRIDKAKSVFIAGTMNGWSSWSTPLKRKDNGVWSTILELSNGEHAYQIITDGIWGVDPSNSDSISNGMGGWNSVLSIKEEGPPPVIHTGLYEKGIKIIGSEGVSVLCFIDDRFIKRVTLLSKESYLLNFDDISNSRKRSHLRLYPVKNGVRGAEVLVPLSYGSPITSTDDLDRRDWHSMIMYFLMVDRFNNGIPSNDAPVNDEAIMPIANHKGGDLTGISLKIADGYLQRLGINTVWLSPITKNAKGAWGLWEDPRTEISSKFSSYHGYWPISNTVIDPAFGSRMEFDILVKMAHSEDMNVILDYVANHIHQDHPIYRENPDWATSLYLPDGTMNTERWDDHRLTTWFDTFLPTLDLAKPEVYSAMTDSALWWVENSDIDGFRHDATKHIPEVFWRTLTSKIKKINRTKDRRLFQIGETYGSPELISSYISSGMLDAQFDFNHYDAAVAAFAFDGDFNSLAKSAIESLKSYGAHNLMGNITGNQDRVRFTSLADGGVKTTGNGKFEGWTQNITHKEGGHGYEKMQLLISYLMSMPGIPCIYYGDEIADVGGNDPDNRRVMRFNDLNDSEAATLSWTSEWTKLRSSRMSLIYGSTTIKAISTDVLEITREYLNEISIIILNKSKKEIEVNLHNHHASRSDLVILAGKGYITGNTINIPPFTAICIGKQD
ncbi:MAG: alpha-amlyase [Bacteroidetes bacterium]|nr:MAG: alpha-amlyase [Bacteroidota bacterium]